MELRIFILSGKEEKLEMYGFLSLGLSNIVGHGLVGCNNSDGLE